MFNFSIKTKIFDHIIIAKNSLKVKLEKFIENLWNEISFSNWSIFFYDLLSQLVYGNGCVYICVTFLRVKISYFILEINAFKKNIVIDFG